MFRRRRRPMPRSSESVAALASALAKAQAELVNPEKSLTASIRTGRPGEGERSFRYAPLSSGLDIVRRTLGQHEIATIQTTAVDQTAGLVNLTTMLAHASGEWIASDWPVCPLADMASPQRMGAALTYARRYALFTLVGIAGEDDIDAPDLNAEGAGSATASSPMLAPSDIAAASASYTRNGQGSGGYQRKSYAPVRQPVLSPQESARLREGMLAEIECIASPEAATAWARTMLRAKNTLTAEDAGLVERAFETKLGGLASDPATDLVGADQAPKGASPDSSAIVPDSGAAKPSGEGGRAPGDRNPPITKTVRHRNKEHLRF